MRSKQPNSLEKLVKHAFLVIATIVALTILILGSLSFSQSKWTSRPTVSVVPTVSVYVNGPISPGISGLILAARTKGDSIEIKLGKVDSDLVGAVTSDSVDVGLVDADAFLTARQKGAPIVAFAAGYLESPIIFYVHEGSRIRTPRNFEGKRIGLDTMAQAMIVYEALMARLELPRSRVYEVAIGASPAPFLNGDVDVWLSSIASTYAITQLNARYRVIAPNNFGIHMLGSVYFATEKTLRERPTLIQRFVDSLILGWERVYADTATSIPLISSSIGAGFNDDRVRFDLDQQREFVRPVAMRFAEFNQHQWRLLQEILVRQQILPETVDLSTAVTYEFVREAYRKSGRFGK